MKLSEQVEYCLDNYPETRGSDKKLTIKLWEKYYSEYIGQDWETGRVSIELVKVLDLPNQESIGRWRRKLQEDGKYLPDDPEITKKRRAHSKTWKKELGYRTQEQAVEVKVSEKRTESHINAINGRLF